jgi:hypothetical protein
MGKGQPALRLRGGAWPLRRLHCWPSHRIPAGAKQYRPFPCLPLSLREEDEGETLPRSRRGAPERGTPVKSGCMALFYCHDPRRREKGVEKGRG